MVPILWSWQEAMRMMWYVFVCSLKKSKVVRTCYWGGELAVCFDQNGVK